MCGITGHRDIYVTFTELEVWSVTISRYLTIFDSCKYSLIAVVIKTTAIDLRFKSELKIRLIEHRWHLLSFKIKRVGMGGLLPTWPRSFTVSSIFFFNFNNPSFGTDELWILQTSSQWVLVFRPIIWFWTKKLKYIINLGYLVIFKILHAGLKQLYVKWHNIDCKNRIINGIFRNTIYTKWGRLIQNMKNSKCQNIK